MIEKTVELCVVLKCDRAMLALVVVVLFHVLDPSELSFNFNDAVLFRDVENEREIYVDPAAARAEYLRRFEEHAEAAAKICRGLGIGYHRLSTARPLELALYDFMRERIQRGKSVRRRGADGGGGR